MSNRTLGSRIGYRRRKIGQELLQLQDKPGSEWMLLHTQHQREQEMNRFLARYEIRSSGQIRTRT